MLLIVPESTGGLRNCGDRRSLEDIDPVIREALTHDGHGFGVVLRFAVMDGHVMATPGQGQDDGATDAARAAGDQRRARDRPPWRVSQPDRTRTR